MGRSPSVYLFLGYKLFYKRVAAWKIWSQLPLCQHYPGETKKNQQPCLKWLLREAQLERDTTRVKFRCNPAALLRLLMFPCTLQYVVV
jgi:hypothetical protein